MPQADVQSEFAKSPDAPANTFRVKVFREDGSQEVIVLPSVIGVMGDYGGQTPHRPPPHERPFMLLNEETFAQVMQAIGPYLSLTFKDMDRVELAFRRMEDFEPDGLVEQVPQLRGLRDLRHLFVELLNRLDGNFRLYDRMAELLSEEPALLDEVYDALAYELPPTQEDGPADHHNTMHAEEAAHA
jgi:type VI secretion system protein ImpB